MLPVHGTRRRRAPYPLKSGLGSRSYAPRRVDATRRHQALVERTRPDTTCGPHGVPRVTAPQIQEPPGRRPDMRLALWAHDRPAVPKERLCPRRTPTLWELTRKSC